MSWFTRRVAPLAEEREIALGEVAEIIGGAFDPGTRFTIGRRVYTVERDGESGVLCLDRRSLDGHAHKRLKPATSNQLHSFDADMPAMAELAVAELPGILRARVDRIATLRNGLMAAYAGRSERMSEIPETLRTSDASTVARLHDAGVARDVKAVASQVVRAWRLRDELQQTTRQWAEAIAHALPEAGCESLEVKVDRTTYTVEPGRLLVDGPGWRSAVLHGYGTDSHGMHLGVSRDITVHDRFADHLGALMRGIEAKLPLRDRRVISMLARAHEAAVEAQGRGQAIA